MEDIVLGEGTSFEDVEQIRKQLTVAEHLEFDREEKIRHLQDELGRQKAAAQWKIDQMVYDLKIDKEARSNHGYTNDNDWLKEIKNNILADDIAEIEKTYCSALETKIEHQKHHKQLNRLRIKNLERKLANRHIYAQALLNGFALDQQIRVPEVEQEPAK